MNNQTYVCRKVQMLFVIMPSYLKATLTIFLLFATIIVAESQSVANYARTWTATAPEQNPNTLITRPLSDVKQVTQYYRKSYIYYNNYK